MMPIQAIAGVLSKILQNAMSGAGAQGMQASQGMDLNAVDDDADQDDDSQAGSPAQASNTLMARELARIQAMLAQASGGQSSGGIGGIGS